MKNTVRRGLSNFWTLCLEYECHRLQIRMKPHNRIMAGWFFFFFFVAFDYFYFLFNTRTQRSMTMKIYKVNVGNQQRQIKETLSPGSTLQPYLASVYHTKGSRSSDFQHPRIAASISELYEITECPILWMAYFTPHGFRIPPWFGLSLKNIHFITG